MSKTSKRELTYSSSASIWQLYSSLHHSLLVLSDLPQLQFVDHDSTPVVSSLLFPKLLERLFDLDLYLKRRNHTSSLLSNWV